MRAPRTSLSTHSPHSPADVTVTVRLFAELRERAGTGWLEARLPAGSRAGDVWAALPPPLSTSPRPSQLAFAVDHVWASPETPLAHGSEVALLLPGSGG